MNGQLDHDVYENNVWMDMGLVKPSKFANYANYAYLSHIYFLIDFNQFDYADYEYSVRYGNVVP